MLVVPLMFSIIISFTYAAMLFIFIVLMTTGNNEIVGTGSKQPTKSIQNSNFLS